MTPGKQLLLPSCSGWYGPTEVGSKVHIMDGSRPRSMESKPVLVGEWPPRSGEGPHGPLSARPAWVLCSILGITYETFLCLFDRVNLLKHWNEDKPPRISSLMVMTTDFVPRGCPIILLGRRVCQVFGFTPGNHIWDRYKLNGEPCVAIPHPSGRNLQYNQLAERLRVKEALERSLLYHGKLFRVGDWPDGRGSLVMLKRGKVWGDAARRRKHKQKERRPNG